MTLAWPDTLFAGPGATTPARVHDADGETITVAVSRWHRRPNAAEHEALSRAVGPVLDIGCGPGRHVLALVGAGREGLGIDVSPVAVRTATRRGAPALVASVFGPVPRPGHWGSGLLLDGNIGIGGDPVALLVRAGEILGAPAKLIVELRAARTHAGRRLVRVEHRGVAGPWFPWATVSPDHVEEVAGQAGFGVEDLWEAAGRWFCVLAPTGSPPRG